MILKRRDHDDAPLILYCRIGGGAGGERSVEVSWKKDILIRDDIKVVSSLIFPGERTLYDYQVRVLQLFVFRTIWQDCTHTQVYSTPVARALQSRKDFL